MNKILDRLKWLDPFTYVDIFLEKAIGKQEGFWKTIVYWGVYLLTAFISALLLYKFIGLFLGVSEPLAIVVSSSMTPSLSIGDVVIFTKPKNLIIEEIEINQNIKNKDLEEFAELKYYVNEHGLEEVKEITIGEKTINLNETIKNNNSVIVYKSNINGKDIIHRAIVKIKAKDGDYILTKGDNHKTNVYIDQDCGKIIVNGKIGVTKPCLNLYPLKLEEIQRKKIGKIPYIGYIKLVLFQ